MAALTRGDDKRYIFHLFDKIPDDARLKALFRPIVISQDRWQVGYDLTTYPDHAESKHAGKGRDSMHRFLIALLALCFVGSSMAGAEPRTPDPIKKAKAEALVARTNSQGVWRVDDTGEITHIQSGLKCAVSGTDDPIQLKELIVYANTALGVSCAFTHTTEAGLTDTTLYVYSAQGLTNELLLAQAAGAIEMAHPDWKRIDGPSLSIDITDKSGNKTAPAAARFAAAGSPERFSSIWVGAIGPWAVKVRATYPKADAAPMELMSLVYWASARMDVGGDK